MSQLTPKDAVVPEKQYSFSIFDCNTFELDGILEILERFYVKMQDTTTELAREKQSLWLHVFPELKKNIYPMA